MWLFKYAGIIEIVDQSSFFITVFYSIFNWQQSWRSVLWKRI